MGAPADAPAPTSRALQRSECLALLRRNHQGRAAFPSGGLLTIVPTPYRLDGGYVVLPARGLEEAAGQVVTFQCDGDDPRAGERWSLCVTGRTVRRGDGTIRLAPDLLRGFAQSRDGGEDLEEAFTATELPVTELPVTELPVTGLPVESSAPD